MRAFRMSLLLEQQEQFGKRYLEFLRVPSLSAGVYRLRAGEPDPQQPHGEDEVYYVVAGRGGFTAGKETIDVSPGTVLFVERGVDHHFIDISEDLDVLVFFAPAESSAKPE